MISNNSIHDYIKVFLSLFILVAVIVLPRIIAQYYFEPMEDELLAISNNIKFSPIQQIFAPDFTHPGFWYLLMEFPTFVLGISHGIFYYRLIQVAFFTTLIVYSVWVMGKNHPKIFNLFFYSLLLSNTYITHITFQHRMYGLVLGLATVYSLYWYELIFGLRALTYKKSLLLGLLAVVGFFTNYSFIWILPIWPLALLFTEKLNGENFKKIAVFLMTVVGGVSWFIPIFLKNTRDSVDVNQWAPELSVKNTLELFGNYFGIIFNQYNFEFQFNFISVLLLVVAIMISYQVVTKKSKSLYALTIALLFGFIFYFVMVFITQNSLLYARVSITLIIPVYILLAQMSVESSKWFRFGLVLLVLIQFAQLVFYLPITQHQKESKHAFSFYHNSLSFLADQTYTTDDCLVPIPFWNTLSVAFFTQGGVEVVPINNMSTFEINQYLSHCKNVFLVQQNSIEPERLETENKLLESANVQKLFIQENENQSYFRLYVNKY
jgi:hypothetical protein